MVDRRIVWVASFPKSGNTWLRFIIFYLQHKRPPADSLELDNYISRHHKPGSGRCFVKTHAASFNRKEFFGATYGAIYVHRHPLDVMCSALNYAQLIGEIDLDQVSDKQFKAWKAAWVCDYLLEGAPLEWMRAHETDTWVRNLESWTREDLPFPVLRVSYKDMLTDSDAAIRSIAEFLSLDATEELIIGCRNATAFSNLRQFEEAEVTAAGAKGRGIGRFSGSARRKAFARGIRFFNTGQSEYYCDVLDDMTIERAERVFGPAAAQVGYSVPFARSHVATVNSTKSSHLEIWSQLSDEIGELRTNLAAKEKEADVERTLNKNLSVKLQDQQNVGEELQNVAKSLTSDLKIAQKKVAKLKNDIVTLRNSVSWRVTRPLRVVLQFSVSANLAIRSFLRSTRTAGE